MITRGTNTCSILDLSNNTFLGLISNQQLQVRYKTNVVSLRQYYYQKLLRILSEKARKNERSHEEIDVQNELATDRKQIYRAKLVCKLESLQTWTIEQNHITNYGRKKLLTFSKFQNSFHRFRRDCRWLLPKAAIFPPKDESCKRSNRRIQSLPCYVSNTTIHSHCRPTTLWN